MVTSSSTIEAGGAVLGIRVAQAPEAPRALIVALHGGTYDSEYYTGPDSLLELGPRVGYTVVAVDRPGYGSSSTVPAADLGFDRQTEMLAAAVEALRVRFALPTVVIGHSIGGMLALQVAAAMSVPPHGVEVSGLGELWQPGLREMWSGLIGEAPAIELPAEAHASVMFGPDHTRTEAAVARNTALLRPMPMPELRDVVNWSDRLPGVAARIAAPVRATLAEHDHIWQADDGARAALAAHFTAGPIETAAFAGAGHSVELHRLARAYVLTQLAFVERCTV